MRELQSNKSAFQKVGECLYRYSNGVYYGRIRVDGKEIKRSLKATDRELAKRRLAEFLDEHRQTDRLQGKMTLVELCKRYLPTIRHQKETTVYRKTAIIARIRSDWPAGELTQVGGINPSDCDLWLSRYILALQ